MMEQVYHEENQAAPPTDVRDDQACHSLVLSR
jgi:hypothetical protein